MASLLKQRNTDAAVMCIDTWLGSLEHFTTMKDHPVWGLQKYRVHGYPHLYYQFIANALHTGVEDMIVPFPTTSPTAARWLHDREIQADMIFIDASHDEEDVFQDLRSYWPLLRDGGVIFGDDWISGWEGVIQGVGRFAKDRGLVIDIQDDIWLIRK
jgi:hypothetical protein